MIDKTTRQYIGLCMAAGGVKTGVDTVLGEIRSQRARLVIVSSDASERTKKQLGDKCSFYKTKMIGSDCSADELAGMIGKASPCAAIALTGRGPWKKVLESIQTNETIETDVPSTTEDRKDDN